MDAFDAMHAFGPPSDPFDSPEYVDHGGVAALRAARDLVLAREPERARSALGDARRAGVPAALAPHAAALDGTARILAGDVDGAVAVLGDAWAQHPDVAVLPALLGAAQREAGDATSAAHSMYAALVCDDPDRSLANHRRLLTLLLQGS